MKKPRIVGHRANHIKTIHYYLKEKVDYIELDIQKKNKSIIVSHGETLASATTLSELFIKLILNSILKKDHLFNPLTLEKAIELIPNNTGLWLDIKSRRIGSEIIKKVIELGYQNVVISTNYYGISRDVKKDWSQVKTAISVSFEPMDPTELIELANKAEAEIIAMEHTYITKELIEKLHEYNMEIAVWTVNSPRYASRIITFNPDYLITDRPDLIKRVLL